MFLSSNKPQAASRKLQASICKPQAASFFNARYSMLNTGIGWSKNI